MENLWEMVAKARGLELNEEFIWQGSRYKITDYDGLIVLDGSWVMSYRVVSFIKGYGVIEKLPFRPQIGDSYYTLILKGEVVVNTWEGWAIDYTRLISGTVFRTREEAEAYLPTWQERISKL